MKTAAIAIALALAMTTLGALGQDAGGPPPPPAGEGPGGGGPGGPGRGGFRLLPPHVVEQLNLTEDQQKQVTDLETEVKAKLEKILTAEQQEQMKQMRPPPRGMGGMGGGPGAGGPGGGPGGAGKGGAGKGGAGKGGGQTPPPRPPAE